MEVFQTGERIRRKADPCNVSKARRKAPNPDASGYFTSQQVAIFSHALLPKENVRAESDDSQDNLDEQMEIIPEEIVQDLTRKVTDEISIQHPLMYANHNICEFAAASKLSKVSVPDAQRHMQVLNLTCHQLSSNEKSRT